MCIFSQKVDSVSATRIFARGTDKAEQYVSYGMKMRSQSDVAMILPIPVRKGSGEKAVTFINLREYAVLFRDLERGFPQPPRSRSLGAANKAVDSVEKNLEVHQVGAFEASFVPTLRDFTRLDRRFRLPDGTWEQLPRYSSYGFVVFKFRPGEHEPHPMAFRFPRADPRKLFFPTVHIHDGKVREKAKFDHVLYAQFPEAGTPLLFGWKESTGPAEAFVNIEKAKKLVDGESHVYRKSMRGMLKNADVLV